MALRDLVNRLRSDEKPTGMVVSRLDIVTATVDDINEALAANPGHKLARVFRKATYRKRGTAKLFCNRADLLALAENREILTHRNVVDGALETSKSVGNVLATTAAVPAANPDPNSPADPNPQADTDPS